MSLSGISYLVYKQHTRSLPYKPRVLSITKLPPEIKGIFSLLSTFTLGHYITSPTTGPSFDFGQTYLGEGCSFLAILNCHGSDL